MWWGFLSLQMSLHLTVHVTLLFGCLESTFCSHPLSQTWPSFPLLVPGTITDLTEQSINPEIMLGTYFFLTPYARDPTSSVTVHFSSFLLRPSWSPSEVTCFATMDLCFKMSLGFVLIRYDKTCKHRNDCHE